MNRKDFIFDNLKNRVYHMKKGILLTMLLTMVLLPLSAFSQMKIGYMNPDSVLRDLPEVATIEAQVQGYIEEREQAFQDRYQAWIALFSEYNEQAQQGLLTEEEIAAKEQELAEEEQELTLLQTRIQNQIAARQNELFTPVLERLDRGIRAVSEQMGLDMVLNRQTGMGDPIIYFAGGQSVDITESVLNYLLENNE